MTQEKISALNEITGHLLDSARGYGILASFPQLERDKSRLESYAKYRQDNALTIQRVIAENWNAQPVEQGKGRGVYAFVSMVRAESDKLSRNDLIKGIIRGDGYMIIQMDEMLKTGVLGEKSSSDNSQSKKGNAYDFVQRTIDILARNLETLAGDMDQQDRENPDMQVSVDNGNPSPAEPADEQIASTSELELQTDQEIVSGDQIALPNMDGPLDIAGPVPPADEERTEDREADEKDIETVSAEADAVSSDEPSKKPEVQLEGNVSGENGEDYVTSRMPHSVPAPDLQKRPSSSNELDPESIVFETALGNNVEEQPEPKRKLRVFMVKKSELD